MEDKEPCLCVESRLLSGFGAPYFGPCPKLASGQCKDPWARKNPKDRCVCSIVRLLYPVGKLYQTDCAAGKFCTELAKPVDKRPRRYIPKCICEAIKKHPNTQGIDPLELCPIHSPQPMELEIELSCMTTNWRTKTFSEFGAMPFSG